MICRSCAEGAQAKADLKKIENLTGRSATMRKTNLRAKINKSHAKCRGGTWCDCQHDGTPSHRATADV